MLCHPAPYRIAEFLRGPENGNGGVCRESGIKQEMQTFFDARNDYPPVNSLSKSANVGMHILRERFRGAKGAGLKIRSRRSSQVQILPLAFSF